MRAFKNSRGLVCRFEEKKIFRRERETFTYFSDGSVRRELERVLNHWDAWCSTGYLVKVRGAGIKGRGVSRREAGKGCQPS